MMEEGLSRDVYVCMYERMDEEGVGLWEVGMQRQREIIQHIA